MKSKFLSARTGKIVYFVTVLYGLCALVVSCGSSRQEDNFETMDESLAESIDQASSSPSAEDEEVLRLLGITPNSSDTVATPGAGPPEVQTTSTSPEEIQGLKDELDQKDREITLLRTQLTQKEAQIHDLEAQVQARPAPPKTTSTFDFKLKYDQALRQYNARSYNEAIAIFSELLMADSEHSLSDNCQYWIGESYYGLQNYNQAISEFEKVFLFPNSNKVDDAQLKLGLCYMRLGDRVQAHAEFDRLLANYPNSEYKAAAQKYLGKLQ
ncbi:tetratricopeptide repeat protein [bacterium]|nr:tetratricopeptide repeat protein [bacterium]